MEKNIKKIKNSCTACRSCEQICPQKAITMKENQEGFLYPVVDDNKCNNCGLCLNRCHVNISQYNNKYKKEIFGLKPIDKEISKRSTSGGVASVISEYILDCNGVVFGSAYDEDLNVLHIKIQDKQNLWKLRGSKYVISDTFTTYSEVKKELDNNVKVLYIGTACQIAGLLSFLNKEYKNLFTIDIVCHGVPSLKIFKKYLKYLEDKYNSKILSYEFRNKERSKWGLGYTAKVVFEDKTKYLKADFDKYYSNFLKGNLCRESCYECKYADINKRLADITIADFWGIEKINREFYDKDGVSLCIVNSDKGKTIYNSIENIFNITSVDEEKVVFYNARLAYPVKRNKVRDNIYFNIDKDDYIKKLKLNLTIKQILKNLLPLKIRLFLKMRLKVEKRKKNEKD